MLLYLNDLQLLLKGLSWARAWNLNSDLKALRLEIVSILGASLEVNTSKSQKYWVQARKVVHIQIVFWCVCYQRFLFWKVKDFGWQNDLKIPNVKFVFRNSHVILLKFIQEKARSSCKSSEVCT